MIHFITSDATIHREGSSTAENFVAQRSLMVLFGCASNLRDTMSA
jgi:hypothetical protein